MTSFTFSAEQVKSAPPEVRRWMENEIAKALGLQPRFEHDSSKMQANALAACTIEEAAQIFSLISGNFLVTQVFFELARETNVAQSIPSLHALSLGDMQRHVQLSDGHMLIECLNVINQALQKARNDGAASLFATDDFGHIYIHETTYQNIRRLREQLVLAHSPEGLSQPAGTSGFMPPREAQVKPEHAFRGGEPEV
jgi:hypothetical protein